MKFDAVKDKWDKESGEGRDDEGARALADEYVAANPAEFETLSAMTLDQLVVAVETFRAAGMEEEQWRVETYLLHKYAPQNIGGPAQATVRIPNGA